MPACRSNLGPRREPVTPSSMGYAYGGWHGARAASSAVAGPDYQPRGYVWCNRCVVSGHASRAPTHIECVYYNAERRRRHREAVHTSRRRRASPACPSRRRGPSCVACGGGTHTVEIKEISFKIRIAVTVDLRSQARAAVIADSPVSATASRFVTAAAVWRAPCAVLPTQHLRGSLLRAAKITIARQRLRRPHSSSPPAPARVHARPDVNFHACALLLSSPPAGVAEPRARPPHNWRPG